MVDLWRHRATSRERNLIERIKAPIFLEAVLAIEMMQKPQYNLEEKVAIILKVIDNPIIYKFFKDFTNHKKKNNRVVDFSCTLFTKAIKYSNH